MCGRHACTLAPEALAKLVGAKGKWPDSGKYMPSYNIGPGRTCAVLRKGKSNGRELCCMTWGFNCGPSNLCINARSETLAEKRSFKQLVQNQRCVVVSQGFYEWKKLKGTKKQPYFLTTDDKKKQEEKVIYFAGVYTTQSTAAGPMECFTIITVPAHSSVESIHDRMPAVIDPDLIDVWLGSDTELALSLLTPRALSFHTVSNYVSLFGNDGPECIKPIDTKDEKNTITKWVVKRGSKKEELEASPAPAEVKSERRNLKRSRDAVVASPASASACSRRSAAAGSAPLAVDVETRYQSVSPASRSLKRVKSETK